MIPRLLLALTVVSMDDCHPSLYLVKLGDKKEDLIDNMASLLEGAEIANRSLTKFEMEQISKDYSDYCNCNCHVHIGDIYPQIRRLDYIDEDNGDYSSLCHCNCNPCSGGDAHNGGGGGGGCTVSGGRKAGGKLINLIDNCFRPSSGMVQ